ncbi:MAG: cupin domain-containing protein, partial [Actinobacteria bacterium]
MSAYTLKRIDEMETAFGGGMRLARAELGVASFGMQVEEFPPNFDQYPEHSHSEDGQEEVYVVLRGNAE